MSTRRLRVFLVDDHPLVREWLASLLRLQPDFEIAGEAADPIDALEAITEAAPEIAIVDLSFKRGSGLDLIKSLRIAAPATRIVVLSMHEEVSEIERALRAGARGYVMKRESTSQIVSAIRRVHAGEIYADAAVLAALAERMVGRPPGAVANSPDSLSDRELDVFRRLGEGDSTRRIATDLQISVKTVQTYCIRIRAKLALSNGAELLRAAMRWHSGSNS